MTSPDPSALCKAVSSAWGSVHPREVQRRLGITTATFDAISDGTHPLTLAQAAEYGLRLGVFPGKLMRSAGVTIPGRPDRADRTHP